MAASRLRDRLLAVVMFVVIAAGGCGNDPNAQGDLLPRRAITGTVSLDGKPLPEGKIQFSPADSTPNLVTVVGEIKDGKFTIDRAQGPVPGKYRVAISGIPTFKIRPDEEPGTAPKRRPEPVPASYNTKTTLMQEITADTPKVFDFALVGK